MTNKINYGPVVGNWDIHDEPVAASQIFHPTGGHLVYMDSSGHMTLALTAIGHLYGWCFAPRSFEVGSTAASNGYFTSSSTAGGTKLPVASFARNPGMRFKMPTTASGGLAVQARVGEACDIVGVNDGTAQYATPGTASTNVLLFDGLCEDGDTNAAYFTINAGSEIQTTT